MSNVIGIMGESGSGKTTSLRWLDPSTTVFIDCDCKGMSWKGWQKQYNTEAKNYHTTRSVNEVMESMTNIANDEKWKHVKVVVVDTVNALMVASEMERMKDKGYDKWQDLAQDVYGMIALAQVLRPDLTIIFIFHSETVTEDTGYMYTRIKTSGRKLNKIVLESMLTTVLYAVVKDGQHKFVLHDDRASAKIPLGCFEGLNEIDNDIALVIKELED